MHNYIEEYAENVDEEDKIVTDVTETIRELDSDWIELSFKYLMYILTLGVLSKFFTQFPALCFEKNKIKYMDVEIDKIKIIMNDQWKVEKIRHYIKQGWSIVSISYKLKMEMYKIYEIMGYDQQTSALGHKNRPYYEDEMDYAKMGPCPLPKVTYIDTNFF